MAPKSESSHMRTSSVWGLGLALVGPPHPTCSFVVSVHHRCSPRPLVFPLRERGPEEAARFTPPDRKLGRREKGGMCGLFASELLHTQEFVTTKSLMVGHFGLHTSAGP